MIETKVEGLDDVIRKLHALGDRKLIRNAARRALRKGANVVRDAARNNAKRIDDPATRRQIWKNIAASGGGKRREDSAGGAMMRVGVRGGARYKPEGDNLPGGNSTGVWRFVELGTSRTRAQPFLRPALSDNTQKAAAAIVADLEQQIDREVAKLR